MDGIGLIVIDVTGIAGSLAEWRTKASAVLEALENAHVLGVALLAKGIDGAAFPRWRFDSSFAANCVLGPILTAPLALISQAFPAIIQH